MSKLSQEPASAGGRNGPLMPPKLSVASLRARAMPPGRTLMPRGAAASAPLLALVCYLICFLLPTPNLGTGWFTHARALSKSTRAQVERGCTCLRRRGHSRLNASRLNDRDASGLLVYVGQVGT